MPAAAAAAPQPSGQPVPGAGEFADLLGTHPGLQGGVEHAGHPVFRVPAQRRLQRQPGQRPVAACVRRECQQHKGFQSPRFRQCAGQQRPQRLGLPGGGADGQRVERVAHRDVGEGARQCRQLGVTERAAVAHPGRRRQRGLDVAPRATVRVGLPVLFAAGGALCDGVGQRGRTAGIGHGDHRDQVGAAVVQPAPVEHRGGGQRRCGRILHGSLAAAPVDAVPAAAGRHPVDHVAGRQVHIVFG